MAGWGLQHDVDDPSRALAFARAARAVTEAVPVAWPAGWSRGGWIGYALLNQESERPPVLRQVDSSISMDNFFKTDDDGARAVHRQLAADRRLPRGGGLRERYRGSEEIRTSPRPTRTALAVLHRPTETNLEATLSLRSDRFPGRHSLQSLDHLAAGVFPDGDTTATRSSRD